MSTTFAQIAIHLAPNDPYAPYVREVIEHAGLVASFTSEPLEDLLTHDVLVLVGRGEMVGTDRERIESWVMRGGQLVCVGSTWGFEKLLGVLPFENLSCSRATTHPVPESPIWPNEARPAPVFGGTFAAATDCEVWARLDHEFVGASRQQCLRGYAYFLAPHVGQTVAMMQLGRAVAVDGIGPCDGSAELADGQLLAEDGAILDYELDRHPSEDGKHRVFGQPHADVLKELLLSMIFRAADATAKAAALTWYWPENQEGAAVISVDCEEWNPDNVFRLKQVMDVSNVPAAWFVAAPGYALDVYRMIRRWDDEVGVLYEPTDVNGWMPERLRSQYLLLHRTSGVSKIVSVRTARTRWEGYTDFYAMSDQAGTRVSMSKGGRQPGTQGYLFGTCHLFHPLRRDGTPMFTAEIPNAIYCPGVVIPVNGMHTVVRNAALRNGCVSLTIPSTFGDYENANIALKQMFLLAQQYRLKWMLPWQIQHFERGRRSMRSALVGPQTWELVGDVPMEGLTVMVTGTNRELQFEGKRALTRTVRRFGMEFTVATLNLGAREQIHVTFATGWTVERAA